MRRAASVSRLLGGIFLLWMLASWGHAQSRYKAVKDPASPPEIPYTRYFTKDKFNRRITFYVHGNQNQRLPLAVSVLGSGAYSNFVRVGGEIRDGHRAAREAFDGTAHVVIVEKPGIAFLEQHGEDGRPSGTARGGSPEFQRENTLDRWAEAVNAALRAARSLPLADPAKTLLVGHSEGALVAALVAEQNPFVTHVASLSGTGPSILFELMRKARDGRLYIDQSLDPDKQVERLMAEVAAVRADPDSTTRWMLGHSYRYWSSRWPYSAMEILPRLKARLFLAHGADDRNVGIENFDLLYAQLVAKGKEVTARRYEGADHGYRFQDQPGRDGWKEVYEEVRNWFFTAR